MNHSVYDCVLFTPDAVTMMTPVGEALVKTIGEVIKGSNAKTLLAGTFHNSKSWFAETSGVSEGRLACIVLRACGLRLPPRLLLRLGFLG